MKKILYLILSVLFCLPLFTGCGHSQDTSSDSAKLEVTFFNCGKADSALLRTEDKAVLIDAGTENDGEYILSRLSEMGVNRLDALIISHMHKDHVGGASLILKSLPVEQVFIGNHIEDSKQLRQFEKMLVWAKLTPAVLSSGDSISIGEITLDVLSSGVDDHANENDLSLVLLASYCETRFLFTGDAEEALLDQLLSLDISLSADILKVPHHGNSSPSSKAFIRAVSPQIAVVTCARNTSDKLPAPSVEKALVSSGSALYITGDGDVSIISDGKTLVVTQ